MLPYLIAIAAVAAVILLLLAFALLISGVAFGRRCDKNPLLKYFTAQDFGLSARPVALPNGLNGFIYGKAEASPNGKLIIFCHGMGPGHIAYTTEIAYFCRLGYTVLAVDSRGCNLSDGKNLKGLYCGVQTAISAIDFARSDEELKGYAVYLVGHSWGAYSALCASAEREVNAVAAISAPVTPSRVMADAASSTISRPLAALLRPFWWLAELFKFGVKGNSNAARCSEKSGAPTLLIHGDRDAVVPLAGSAYSKARGKNVTRLLAKGKAHNPYNTQNAEKLLAGLSANLARVGKMTEEERQYFSAFDYSAATEEDAQIMSAIEKFFSEN